jgi:hypothetical protein
MENNYRPTLRDCPCNFQSLSSARDSRPLLEIPGPSITRCSFFIEQILGMPSVLQAGKPAESCLLIHLSTFTLNYFRVQSQQMCCSYTSTCEKSTCICASSMLHLCRKWGKSQHIKHFRWHKWTLDICPSGSFSKLSAIVRTVHALWLSPKRIS